MMMMSMMVASERVLGGQGRGGAGDQFFLHKSQDGTPYFSCSHFLQDQDYIYTYYDYAQPELSKCNNANPVITSFSYCPLSLGDFV